MDVSGDPLHYFHANPTVDDLIAQQRKEPMREPRILLGDFARGRANRTVPGRPSAVARA
jgi:hypothetical protein